MIRTGYARSRTSHGPTRLVASLGTVGDVLLAGPAVRAVAAAGDPVALLTSSIGAPAAERLPGVERVVTFDARWVSSDFPELDRHRLNDLLTELSGVDEAIVLTSFGQSPLLLALLLRLAGVGRIAATGIDYPGSLVDVRCPYLDEVHEVDQSLSVCQAAGYELPYGDDARLSIRLVDTGIQKPSQPYVVVHPDASVPARRLPVDQLIAVIEKLTGAGYHVTVTGKASDARRVLRIASWAFLGQFTTLIGRTDFADLAWILAGADAVVCGNTAVAHLAAAVGTPVVQAFAPVVPAHRRRPWQVPHVLLGQLDIGCRGCRMRVCPVAGQPCLEPFTAEAVLEAVTGLSDSNPNVGSALRI